MSASLGGSDGSLSPPEGVSASPNGSTSDISTGTTGNKVTVLGSGGPQSIAVGNAIGMVAAAQEETAESESEPEAAAASSGSRSGGDGESQNDGNRRPSAVNIALTRILEHQIDFVDVLNEHRNEHRQEGGIVDAARDAAQDSPYFLASIELVLLSAYFLTGAGYYFNVLFGLALAALVLHQAAQLYNHMKMEIASMVAAPREGTAESESEAAAAGSGSQSGIYNRSSYALIFLLICAIVPVLLIFFKAGFNLWLLAIPSIAYNALLRITSIVAKGVEENRDGAFRKVLFAVASALLAVQLFFFDEHWGAGDFVVITFGLIAMAGFAFTAKTKEFMLFCLVGGTVVTAIGINILIDHPCTICAWDSFENSQPLFSDYFGSNAEKPISQMWRILVDDSGYGVPHECGTCFETISILHHATQDTAKPLLNSYYAAVGAYGYFFGDPEISSSPVSVAEVEVGDFEDSITSSNLRKWNQWYDGLLKQDGLSLSDVERFFVALASNITTCDGQGKLGDAVYHHLCKPTSRASGGPSPSEFLMQIQTPRFTGEASETGKPMSLTMGELKRIIGAGDMAKLGPPTCFMQVFVNALSPNMNIENEIMDPSNISPIANEFQLRGEDISFLFPAVYVPRTDEDRDPTGEGGDIVEGAFTLYRQLPMIDPEHIFLKSKEEYISWFRWNIEHKLQDEFYFPRWLSNGIESIENEELYDQRKAAAIRKRLMKDSGEIRSMQFEYRSDRLSLTDASSDQTLSDRAFFGSGSKRMARIQLPGDSQYGFLLDSSFYKTQAERDAFDLTSSMPKEHHFQQMAKYFWGKDVPFEKLRKKLNRNVVQVDYMEISFVDTRESFERNGSILYLDVVTRKPMGIWLANTKEMILPSRDLSFCEKKPGTSHDCPWEHAKFIHRCTELTLIAMRHAGEYHIGYANVLSTAIRQTLPEFHPLRAFLKPYTHGTGTVDWVANSMLLQDRSVLHRASGFTRRARGFAFGTFQKHMNYTETLPEELKAKKLNGMASTTRKNKPSFTSALWKREDITNTMPMFNAAMRNWKVHHSFVDKYLKVIYPNDAAISSDTALYRFWHSIDTWNRHMDVCLCKMDSDVFFTEGQWPAFETSKTCLDLLNFVNEGGSEGATGPAYARRREQWCKRDSNERKNQFHNWLESECIKQQKGTMKTEWDSEGCHEEEIGKGNEEEECLSYENFHMRSDMDLPSTITRSTLVDVLTKFIYEVTLGHEMAADNIPYMADPSYGGVRISKNITATDNEILVDFATYIYGNVIAAATTIRSMPLLADWSELLVHWVDEYKVKEWSDDKRKKLKKEIRMIHLQYKADLVHLSNELMKETLKRPKNEWAPYLNPATQASSIAV